MIRMNLEEILRAFYTISGMDISVLDRDFHTIFLTRSPGATPCTEIHRDPSSIDICKASDIERLLAARNDLCPILYTCPFGITEVIVPILRDDTPIGYIISTLGIEQGKERDVLLKCSARCAETVEPLVNKAYKLKEEEINAYFRMLKILASYIADDSSLAEGYKSIGQLTKRYIKNNITRKLTLRDIAKNLHCCTVTLTEHFREEFGITINEYITKKRMELAENLLLTTDNSLREIASSTGFSDVEYFSRTFKNHHGESPAKWRRKKKTDMENDMTHDSV